jgi:prostaglandin-endoperoxide synthase 2
MPSFLEVNGGSIKHDAFRNNNELFETVGLPTVIEAASCTRAGKISLYNSPYYLMDAERASVMMSRAFRLRSYNDYREHFGMKRLRSFEELTTNRDWSDALKDLYKGDIDRLEYLPGVFGEAAESRRLVGELMAVRVAYDAFTQIYSNPLIAETIFNRKTFTEDGLKEIGRTSRFQDLVDRNLFDDEKCQHPGTPIASLEYVKPKGAAAASGSPSRPKAT